MISLVKSIKGKEFDVMITIESKRKKSKDCQIMTKRVWLVKKKIVE